MRKLALWNYIVCNNCIKTVGCAAVIEKIKLRPHGRCFYLCNLQHIISVDVHNLKIVHAVAVAKLEMCLICRPSGIDICRVYGIAFRLFRITDICAVFKQVEVLEHYKFAVFFVKCICVFGYKLNAVFFGKHNALAGGIKFAVHSEAGRHLACLCMLYKFFVCGKLVKIARTVYIRNLLCLCFIEIYCNIYRINVCFLFPNRIKSNIAV